MKSSFVWLSGSLEWGFVSIIKYLTRSSLWKRVWQSNTIGLFRADSIKGSIKYAMWKIFIGNIIHCTILCVLFDVLEGVLETSTVMSSVIKNFPLFKRVNACIRYTPGFSVSPDYFSMSVHLKKSFWFKFRKRILKIRSFRLAGVSIVIPPGSIHDNQTQEVYFKVCSRGLPPFAPSIHAPAPLDQRTGETLLSPLVMCGPQGLRFNKVSEVGYHRQCLRKMFIFRLWYVEANYLR